MFGDLNKNVYVFHQRSNHAASNIKKVGSHLIMLNILNGHVHYSI